MTEIRNWREGSRFLRAQAGSQDPVNRLASRIASIDGEVARFLASGMLDYLACRAGGHCHCGKALEDRECVALEDSLLPAIQLSIKHWQKSVAEGREEVIKQIRSQWPEGLLIADDIAGEEGQCDHVKALVSDLVTAARSAVDDTVAHPR